jgi:hypothetical protein
VITDAAYKRRISSSSIVVVVVVLVVVQSKVHPITGHEVPRGGVEV